MPVINSEGAEEIEFEVKDKLVLSLTREGLIYQDELVKDGGKVLELMTKFLGLAEEEIQAQAHEEVVTCVAKLGEIRDQKTAMLIIQSSSSGQDDSRWANMHQADIPDWVKNPEAVSDMMKGGKVQADGGGLWYRACHVLEDSTVTH